MLRGWLLHGCAAPAVKKSIVQVPRLLPHHSTSRVLQHAAQQQLLPQQKRPSVVCLVAGGTTLQQIGKPYSSKAAGSDHKAPVTSFDDMGLNPQLLEALKAASITTPTEIQVSRASRQLKL